MITHRKLAVPNFEQCDLEIKNAFNTMHGVNTVKTFWTFEDDDKFFSLCPTVVDSFKQLGVTIQNAFLIYVASPDENVIHIDWKSNPVRVNWPILNHESVITRFYEPINEGKLSLDNPHGAPYIKFEPSEVRLVDECILDGPTLIRVDIPHNTNAIPNMPLPRIGYSFNFIHADVQKMKDLLNVV